MNSTIQAVTPAISTIPENHRVLSSGIDYDGFLSVGSTLGPQDPLWEKIIMAFGKIDRVSSGRWRARYLNPQRPYKEGGRRNYVAAPSTFTTKTQARQWLAGIQADIARGEWKSAEDLAALQVSATPFGPYAEAWLKNRRLKASTVRSYESLLKVHLLPEWENVPLDGITTAAVRSWLTRLAPGSPGARKRAFDLFKTILGTAEEDDLLERLPFKKNMLESTLPAPAAKDGEKVQPRPYSKRGPRSLSAVELRAVVSHMPEYMQLMTELCGLTGLRTGEARELRRKDLSRNALGEVRLTVSRGVTGHGKDMGADTPKTVGSIRDVYVPPPLDRALWKANSRKRSNDLLFSSIYRPGEWIPETTFGDNLARAGKRAGVGHVAPHDLRRTAVSLAQEHGASLTEIQDMVGHTTPSMTMRYSMSANREKAQAALAQKMGELYSDTGSPRDARRADE